MKRSIVIVALLFGMTLNSPLAAQAQDNAVVLGVSPAIVDITINPGQSISRTMIVENRSEQPVALKEQTLNFEANGPDGAISFHNDTSRQYASSSWIKVQNPNLVLAPHQRQVLSFTINCPQDAEPGGHYATILLEPLAASTKSNSSTIGIAQRVGTLLFIKVDGNVVEQGNVLGVSTDTQCHGPKCSFTTASWREWGPVPFTFQFENTGNTHVKVDSQITITDMFGRIAGTVQPESKTVLPASARTFGAIWPRELLLGRYTAKLTVTYGAFRRTESAQVSFWVIPWRALTVLMALVITTGLAGWSIRHRRQKRLT